jgi:two-component sensor histidine kinase
MALGRTRIAAAQRQAALGILLLVVALIVTNAGIAYAFGRRTVREVRRLAEGVAHLAVGDLSHEVPAAGKSELADLARSFNRMATSLRESEAQVAQHTAALEDAKATLQADLRERVRVEVDLRKALTREQEAVATNQTLLREVHHRTKNNLQMLCDMLFLEAELLEEPLGRQALERSYTRVYAFARLHEQLHRSLHAGRIRFNEYLTAIVAGFRQVYPDASIRLDLPTEPVTFDVDRTLHLGLIINELVTNALKHAFPSGEPGEIGIAARLRAEHIELRVWDTGKGLPADFDPATASTLGLRIVHILARRLQADITVERHEGAAVTLTFPLHAEAPLGPAA